MTLFTNIVCRFQEAGGITIGDGTLIRHGSTIVTLNHAVDPEPRADHHPAPVVTAVPGVTPVPVVTPVPGA